MHIVTRTYFKTATKYRYTRMCNKKDRVEAFRLCVTV